MQKVISYNRAAKQAIKAVMILAVIGLFWLPNWGYAAMQSESYIIYENILHTFDGPIISNVASSISGQTVTVTWDTNIVSDSYVIYSEESSFATSREQGMSSKSFLSHSVDVTGLNANTTYYYRVRSERVNGGITTDTTSRTFTTGNDTPPAPETPSVSGGGGGVLIIDKTDKVPPLITNVTVVNLTAETAAISWDTDEEATSFVEYGEDNTYGNTYGNWSTSTSHTVTLINLQPETEYHFRALSSDNWGNISHSPDQTFITGTGTGEEQPTGEQPTEEPAALTVLAQQALDFISRLFPQVSLNELTNINTINDLSGFIATPVLIGEPDIEVGATEVTIRWSTDIDANSLVALAAESAYNPEATEPYQQVIGDPEVYTADHEVILHGLTPDTTYHFQVRSGAQLGPIARSRDFNFRTSIEELQIVSYLTQIIDNETAVFKWVTNKEADSAVTFTPYYNNVLAVDQAKTVKNNAVSVVHEVEITEFVAGTYYEVELVSMDDKGNEARRILSRFSTTEDDLPPVISHIKTDSTVFVDTSNKIQTVISWLTNEPSTSRVYYQEGVHGGDSNLSESTELNTNYTKEHIIVITKFKPGIVYSFRVESIDSGSNATVSSAHTFMTAKKKESIITIIMNILENTFGWAKKLM